MRTNTKGHQRFCRPCTPQGATYPCPQPLSGNRKEDFYPDYLFPHHFLEKTLFQKEVLAFCLLLEHSQNWVLNHSVWPKSEVRSEGLKYEPVISGSEEVDSRLGPSWKG